MKKFTILFLFILFGIISCKKENKEALVESDKISLVDAVVISRGELIFTSSTEQTGLVKIYRQKNGKYVLGLEQITMHSNNDLSVYFSATETLSSNALKLFTFKTINGHMYYELPGNINISSFPFLLIQGDISQQPIGIAELK